MEDYRPMEGNGTKLGGGKSAPVPDIYCGKYHLIEGFLMGLLSRPQPSPATEDGFTLVELIVVILIIGILAAIAIPAFLNQRKLAIEKTMDSDLRNTAQTMEMEFLAKNTYPSAIPASAKTSGENVLSTGSAPTADITPPKKVFGGPYVFQVDKSVTPDATAEFEYRRSNVPVGSATSYGLFYDKQFTGSTGTAFLLIGSLNPADGAAWTNPSTGQPSTSYINRDSTSPFTINTVVAVMDIKAVCNNGEVWYSRHVNLGMNDSTALEDGNRVSFMTTGSGHPQWAKTQGTTNTTNVSGSVGWTSTGCTFDNLQTLSVVPTAVPLSSGYAQSMHLKSEVVFYTNPKLSGATGGATCIQATNPGVDFARKYDFVTKKITTGTC